MHFFDVRGRVQIIALLELAAERGREQGRDCGFAGSGDAHDNGDHRPGDGVRDGCGPHAPRLAIKSHHRFLRGYASASAGAQCEPHSCHEGHALAGRRINFRTALAKPSLSLLSVTVLACAFTSSLELPMAMEKPLLRNMRTSFGMSPIVAICSS